MMPPLIHENGKGKGLVDALAETKPHVVAQPFRLPQRSESSRMGSVGMMKPMTLPPSAIEAGLLATNNAPERLQEIEAAGLVLEDFVVWAGVLRLQREHAAKYNALPSIELITTRWPDFTFVPGERSFWLAEMTRIASARRAQLILRDAMLAAEADPATAIADTIEKLGALTTARPTDELPFMTGPELALFATDTQWLIEQLIPLGVYVELIGQMKDGKSTFAWALVKRLILGGTWWGQPVMQTPVVYLSEQGIPSARHQMRGAGLLELDDFHTLSASQISDRTWPDVATRAVQKAIAVGAKLLVVDNVLKFAGLKENGENDNPTMLALLKPMDAATAVGITVWFIRHPPKNSTSMYGRGAGSFTGAMDVVFGLHRHSPDAASALRVLETTGRFTDTIPARMVIERLPGGEYRNLGDVQRPVQTKAETALLDAMPTSEADALPRDQLLAEIGDSTIKPATAKSVLARLVQVGTIIAVGKGVRGDPERYYCWRKP